MPKKKKKTLAPVQPPGKSKKRSLSVDGDEGEGFSQKKRKQSHIVEKEITTMGKAILEEEIDMEPDIVGTGTFSQVYKGLHCTIHYFDLIA